ncbi:TetR/AcrR family transcriptional regulator [Pedobacter cryoconitis]|uniref:TetR/AcrR family transcriptional regulator n=1 Tax=Pedobacter cryoconitis TaxID=188932 RepID=UPI001619C392|nr:TetR/AcrR family transcriptional regulator [Pedobacter cryoconitis]MBB5646500.1 AcrR family transcriptional regulator [Pedobacter cryoconitis]
MESKDNVKHRNKEQTKRKLLQAVGEIIIEKGYSGLGVNKIANKAGVDKKLIYRYFGDGNTLVETYILEKDYWLGFADKLQEFNAIKSPGQAKEIISAMLERQFIFLYEEEAMQHMVLEELTSKSPLMASICNIRGNIGASLLKHTDPYFKDSEVNFRAVSALLVSGIYYLVLQAKINGGTICGIDVNSPEGREEVIKTIRHIIEWAYEAPKKQTKEN